VSEKSPWEIFNEECSGVARAYMDLSREINIGESLDEKTRNLILVGIYSVTRDPVALRHFVRMSLEAGASKEEIEAAALLAFNIGVSSAEMSIPIIKEETQNE
jgi:alkylhydroperoxidase/carboxymuconolactone decarboxylase family protein YurZ